jgi:hypothetical protein
MFLQVVPKGPSWGRTFVFNTDGEVLKSSIKSQINQHHLVRSFQSVLITKNHILKILPTPNSGQTRLRNDLNIYKSSMKKTRRRISKNRDY